MSSSAGTLDDVFLAWNRNQQSIRWMNGWFDVLTNSYTHDTDLISAVAVSEFGFTKKSSWGIDFRAC